jgi:Calcineurin-like phosphoesterase
MGSPSGSSAGIGVTANTADMQATAQILNQFDRTGSFDQPAPAVPASAGAPQTSAETCPVGQDVMQCAKMAAQAALFEVTNPTRAAQIKEELEYSNCDPIWAECLAQYEAWRASGGSQPYVNYANLSDFVIEDCFPDFATIAVIGDWGTGMNDALVLLQQIGANFKPDVLMHLGDIYYSGLPEECNAHFTQLIEKVWPGSEANQTPLIFTLDGNHDRYAGSNGGYYNLIATLNQAAGKPQPNSYFALRNNFWQFVAMDTGYNDSDPFSEGKMMTSLVEQEIPWHLDKIRNSSAGVDKAKNPSGVRGTVMLSHHQLFSATGVGTGSDGRQMAVNPNLVRALAPVFPLIDLWLWGHEHALCIFEPYGYAPGQPLPKGRCVGASAVPVYLDGPPSAPAVPPPGETGPPQVIPGTTLGNNGTVFNYCYAIIQLNGPELNIRYYQVDSTGSQPGNPPPLSDPLYSESISKPVAAA